MPSWSEPDAFLLVTGVHGGRKVLLDQGNAWTIGRTQQNHVALADDLVSRNHALIQCAIPGEYFLIDLGSRNGSFVNGTRVSTPRRIKDGDTIQIGGVTLEFHGAAAADQALRSQAGEFDQTRASYMRRLLTVLVVDICDFTHLAQQTEESVLCETIGTWFGKGGKAAQDHGSWTQKYIGDAIMSIWLHDTLKPDLVPIFKAYLEIARLTADLGKQYALPHPLRIGAGINTGVAIVGNTGSTDSADFTAMGETVVAAFRIETAAKQIGADLVIGAATFESLGSGVQPERYFKRQAVQLKGYDQPANVWAADLNSVRRFLADAMGTG